MHRKSASEHNFSEVGCNFRVSQSISPRVNKIQVFSGSFMVSRVCWPPCGLHNMGMMNYLKCSHKNVTKIGAHGVYMIKENQR